jgi:ribokinase
LSDIVGIGSTVYDTLMVTGDFPVEDTKLQASGTTIQGGGPCATALVAAAKLGVSCEYMGNIGSDVYGRFMIGDLARYGVGTQNTIVKNGCISYNSFVILNSKTSTRTCIWSKGTLPDLAPDEVCADAVRNAKVLHLDGHQMEAAIHAAKMAKAGNVKVSLDAGGVYPGIERLLPLVDFLIPSEEFALKFTGQANARAAAAELFSKYNPEFVLVTQGAGGGFIFDGAGYTGYESFKVDALDSNGAGDVFHGAFIAGYVKGLQVKDAAYFASAAAAIKCTKVGARAGAPSWNETIEFLGGKGCHEF